MDVFGSVFEKMDGKGFSPCQNCKKCGNALNKNGDYPAELYAGTFTGLCYTCERAAPYLLERMSDGMLLWSFPPHCPSWRRDREFFYGWEDCSACKGKGRILVKRSMRQGGSYSRQCRKCSDKRWGRHGGVK